MDLRGYVRLLRRRWRLILVCLLATLTASIVLTLTSTRMYTAKTQLFVSAEARSAADVSNAYTGGLFTQQRVKSYVSILESARMGDLIRSDIGGSESPDQIAKHISAAAPIDTVLINVSVTNKEPGRAQAIANSIDRVFPVLVDQIERPSSGGTSPVRVSVVQPPALPSSPTSPRPKINLVIGFLVGLVAGVGAAALRESLDTSVNGPEQTRELVGAPILGSINYDVDAAKQPLVVVATPSSARSEAFRQLRTNLQFVDIEHPLRSVVFTSSVPGEGKSTTTCNLAITLTQAGLRVVLVEGDLRRPRIADYMGLEGAVGLTSVLLGRTSLDHALQTWGNTTLQVLPSGPLPPNPSELLGSQGMQDLLRELERRVDIVIIDAPPLLPVTDAAVLGTLTSGLVMLVRANATKREQVSNAVATVHAVGGVLLGAVLNMVPTRGPNAYSYGYGYSYQQSGSVHRLLDHESPVGEARRSDTPRPDKPVESTDHSTDKPAAQSSSLPPAAPTSPQPAPDRPAPSPSADVAGSLAAPPRAAEPYTSTSTYQPAERPAAPPTSTPAPPTGPPAQAPIPVAAPSVTNPAPTSPPPGPWGTAAAEPRDQRPGEPD